MRIRKVITRICGGLGNQMFTYAVGERLARKYGVPQEYDLIEYFSSKYIFRKGISTRTFQLSCFKGPRQYRKWPLWKSLAVYFFTAVELAIRHGALRRLLGFLGIHLHQSGNLYFPDADENPHGKRAIYSNWLMFSTEKMPSRAELMEEFALAEPLADRNVALRDRMRGVESVSLHVRRTDYLIQPMAWNLSMDYYRRAIDVIRDRVSNPKWFVFSDDPEWCRAQFADLPEVTFVTGNADCPWEDLELMKCCRHHVLANSTFSWWGAYLAYDETGIAICPGVWPCAGNDLPDTFILQRWIRVLDR